MEKNILIIEDDEFFRELISKSLVSNGFEVLEAINGQKGIERAKESKPDLILLDLLIPGTDGFEVLSALKSSPETASIPVIIISNLSTKEDIERGLRLGASDFFIKSQFASEEIIQKIKNFL